MLDLIAKLESAKEGSRELDAAIAVRVRAVAPDTIFWKPPFAGRYSKNDELFEVRRYTTSFDSALTLVPEGWAWGIADASPLGDTCAAQVENDKQSFDGIHDKPVLALVIAALKTRAQ